MCFRFNSVFSTFIRKNNIDRMCKTKNKFYAFYLYSNKLILMIFLSLIKESSKKKKKICNSEILLFVCFFFYSASKSALSQMIHFNFIRLTSLELSLFYYYRECACIAYRFILRQLL